MNYKQTLLSILDSIERKFPGGKMPMLTVPFVRDMVNSVPFQEPNSATVDMRQYHSGSNPSTHE